MADKESNVPVKREKTAPAPARMWPGICPVVQTGAELMAYAGPKSGSHWADGTQS